MADAGGIFLKMDGTDDTRCQDTSPPPPLVRAFASQVLAQVRRPDIPAPHSEPAIWNPYLDLLATTPLGGSFSEVFQFRR